MGRFIGVMVAAALLAAGPARAATDLNSLASGVVEQAHARSTTEKVRAVIGWTHAQLAWTGTDYQNRTVQQVLDRKGGNCRENARVATALLNSIGVRTRLIHEINIQPEKASRETGSEALIATKGLRSTVFGLRHNDHVWVEYFDEQAREWAPADPTLSLVGYDAWTRARLGFGKRIDSDLIPSRDMLAPIAVFVETPRGDGFGYEDRGERYLIQGFRQAIPSAASSPAWKTWERQVRAFQAKARRAFEATHNLHEDNGEILALQHTYERIRAHG